MTLAPSRLNSATDRWLAAGVTPPTIWGSLFSSSKA